MTWTQRIWNALRNWRRRQDAEFPDAVRVVNPFATVPPFGPSDGLQMVGGAESRQWVMVDGVPLPVGDTVMGLVTADGRVIEHTIRAYVTLGDGSVTQRLDGCGVCALCAQAAAASLQQGQLGLAQAVALSMARREGLRCSELSGLPLCRRHQRAVWVDGRTIVVSIEEERQMAKQQRLAALTAKVVGLFVGGADDRLT